MQTREPCDETIQVGDVAVKCGNTDFRLIQMEPSGQWLRCKRCGKDRMVYFNAPKPD